MSKRLHIVEVRGRENEWGLGVVVTKANAAEMRADGLTIHEIENTIPETIAAMGLARPWIWLQDLWNFKWRRSQP